MTHRILVIRFGSLGDVILSSAAVLNLRLSYPEHEIVYLTKAAYGDLVALMPGVDEVVCLPPGQSWLQEAKLFLGLDDRNFEFVIDLHGQPRSLIARKLISAGQTIVYPKRRLDRMLATRRHKQLPSAWPHTIDLYNSAVAAAGGSALCRRPRLDVDPGPLPQLLEPGSRDRPLVVIAPGAAHETKRWPVERFVEVAKAMHDELGATILWATISSDSSSRADLSSIDPDHVMRPTDTPLPELAAMMSQALVTVANDSGVAHLSSAVGTPVVAVFGPTHPVLGFEPRGLFDEVVQTDEFCRPCSLHGRKPCWRAQRYCMERIDHQEVASTAIRLARQAREARPALLVDRDGTIIVDKHYQSDPDGIELIEGAAEGLRRATESGYRIIILSNQSGVARGMFGIDAVDRMNQRLVSLLKEQGVAVDGVYYCPHHPDGADERWRLACDCRKPAPGMAEQAARSHNLDLRRSVVIGDKIDDYALGRVIGAQSVLVRTGHGAEHEHKLDRARITCGLKVAANLQQAVREVPGDQ